MGDWGNSVNKFLNGDKITDPSDFSKLMGRNLDNWHPEDISTISAKESGDRDPLKSENKSIGRAFEEYAANNYTAELVDNGAVDIRIGLGERAQGWPVQVKSTALYVKKGFRNGEEQLREGSFKLREEHYEKLPEESFILFNVYNPAYRNNDRGINVIELENEDMYIEVLGELLLPKPIVEEYVDPDWYSNGQYDLRWTDLFGETKTESPIYQGIRTKEMEDEELVPSHNITMYSYTD